MSSPFFWRMTWSSGYWTFSLMWLSGNGDAFYRIQSMGWSWGPEYACILHAIEAGCRTIACDQQFWLTAGYRRLLHFLCRSSVTHLNFSVVLITVILAHIFYFGQISTIYIYYIFIIGEDLINSKAKRGIWLLFKCSNWILIICWERTLSSRNKLWSTWLKFSQLPYILLDSILIRW